MIAITFISQIGPCSLLTRVMIWEAWLIIFIGPKSDHWLPLSLADRLTQINVTLADEDGYAVLVNDRDFGKVQ